MIVTHPAIAGETAGLEFFCDLPDDAARLLHDVLDIGVAVLSDIAVGTPRRRQEASVQSPSDAPMNGVGPYMVKQTGVRAMALSGGYRRVPPDTHV